MWSAILRETQRDMDLSNSRVNKTLFTLIRMRIREKFQEEGLLWIMKEVHIIKIRSNFDKMEAKEIRWRLRRSQANKRRSQKK